MRTFFIKHLVGLISHKKKRKKKKPLENVTKYFYTHTESIPLYDKDLSYHLPCLTYIFKRA